MPDGPANYPNYLQVERRTCWRGPECGSGHAHRGGLLSSWRVCVRVRACVCVCVCVCVCICISVFLLVWNSAWTFVFGVPVGLQFFCYFTLDKYCSPKADNLWQVFGAQCAGIQPLMRLHSALASFQNQGCKSASLGSPQWHNKCYSCYLTFKISIDLAKKAWPGWSGEAQLTSQLPSNWLIWPYNIKCLHLRALNETSLPF